MKKFLIVLLCVSLLVTLAGFVLPHMYLQNTDIIGGADMFSLRFYYRTPLGKVCLLMQQFGTALVISCGVYLCFFKAFCLKRTAAALCLSAFTATALSSALLFASCFIMTSPQKHPIALPASVILGCISLAAFCLLLWYYTKLWRKEKSKKGIFCDAVMYVCLIVPFAYLFDILYSAMSKLI